MSERRIDNLDPELLKAMRREHLSQQPGDLCIGPMWEPIQLTPIGGDIRR